jgi:hypothetical protein
MAPQTGDIGGLMDIDAVQIPNGDLHVVAATYSGGLYHAVRFNDGSWTPWGDVKGQVGDYGPFTRVGICFTSDTANFIVLGIANGRLWLTMRHGNGSWYPGMWDGDATHVGPFYDADCAYAGSTGHVVALAQPQGPAAPYAGNLYHQVLFQTNLAHVPGDPGSFTSIDATVVGTTLQVTGARGGQAGDDGLWLTNRNGYSGAWSAFQTLQRFSVDAAGGELLGELHAFAMAPGTFPGDTFESSNTLRANGTWAGWAPLYTSYSTTYFSGAYHWIHAFRRMTASGGLAY